MKQTSLLLREDRANLGGLAIISPPFGLFFRRAGNAFLKAGASAMLLLAELGRRPRFTFYVRALPDAPV